MRKSEMLKHWKAMPANTPVLPAFRPLTKPKGSTFGACGVRIDGSPEFIDSVLSRLKDVLDGENHVTRLACSYQPAVTGFKEAPNAAPNAHVCYIRLHVRGHEGMMASGVFDRDLDGATDRFEKAITKTA
jgi:hypothetical protein